MKLFKKAICAIKGHTPYLKPEAIARLSEKDFKKKDDNNLFIINGTSIQSAYGSFQVGESTLTLSHIPPYETKLMFCRRCHSAYFNNGINEEILTDINSYPALVEYKKWLDQMEWEYKAHQEHPTIKKAWDAYQLAIKMCKENK